MELLSIEVFFPVFGERLKIFCFGQQFICEYEKVYLLLNLTENKPHSGTAFAELTRPYMRILNQSMAQMQPHFQKPRQAILSCSWRFLQHREQSCTAPTIRVATDLNIPN